MKTSKQSLIGVAVLFAIAATGACGSDASAPTTPTAGAPGAGAAGAHAGAAGAPASGGGGATSAGAPGAGAPSAGAGGSPTAGAGGSVTAGAGGASGGAGGATAGAGGGSAGGGNTATFAKVSALLGTSCAGNTCHSAASAQADLTTATGLYTRLTTPFAAADTAHCKGETLITAGDASKSFLLKAIQGASTCKNNNGTEQIGRMPESCPGQRPCLTADQIKLISDWVAAGAPM